MTESAKAKSNYSVPLPWHNELWQSFNQLIDNQRLPHALILNGLEGVGAEGRRGGTRARAERLRNASDRQVYLYVLGMLSVLCSILLRYVFFGDLSGEAGQLVSACHGVVR